MNWSIEVEEADEQTTIYEKKRPINEIAFQYRI